tara:strand:- start:191 stop:508 length:318 start_codon:yes stop_codon:yes gene_type:complete
MIHNTAYHFLIPNGSEKKTKNKSSRDANYHYNNNRDMYTTGAVERAGNNNRDMFTTGAVERADSNEKKVSKRRQKKTTSPSSSGTQGSDGCCFGFLYLITNFSLV